MRAANPEDDMPSAAEMRESFKLFESGDVGVRTRRQVALAVSLHVAKDFYATLMELHWSICTASSGESFLTGDAPVTTIVIHEDGRAQFGANYAHPGFELSFPISPSVALYLTRKPRQARYACSAKRVRELNRRTAYMAERFVFSRFKSSATVALVREASVTRKLAKVDAAEARRMVRKSA